MHPYCLVCLRTAGFPILSHPCPWPPYTVHIPRLLFLIRSPSVVVSCLFITLHPRFSHLPDISLSYSLLLSKSTLFVPFFETCPSRHIAPVGPSSEAGSIHIQLHLGGPDAPFFFFSKINRQRMHIDEFPSHPLLLHSSTRRPPPAALHPPSSYMSCPLTRFDVLACRRSRYHTAICMANKAKRTLSSVVRGVEGTVMPHMCMSQFERMRKCVRIIQQLPLCGMLCRFWRLLDGSLYK